MRTRKTPDAVHDANQAGLAEKADHRATLDRIAAEHQRQLIDTRPTPAQIAAICRAAKTDAEIDAAWDAYNAASAHWTQEQLAEYGEAMKP